MRNTIGLAFAMVAITMGAVGAQTTTKSFGFLTHAAFFSLESKQANLLDPQAFVADATAQAGVGPQGIVHIAGFRTAYGVEDPATPLYNAHGKLLGMTAAAWFGARGTVTISPMGADTTAALSFSELMPGGRYSLFENHFGAAAVTFTPLDGTAKMNSFTAGADGRAKLIIRVPGTITHAEAVLLVYHSDGVDHGMQRGDIGVNAHHQLIMRSP